MKSSILGDGIEATSDDGLVAVIVVPIVLVTIVMVIVIIAIIAMLIHQRRHIKQVCVCICTCSKYIYSNTKMPTKVLTWDCHFNIYFVRRLYNIMQV